MMLKRLSFAQCVLGGGLLLGLLGLALWWRLPISEKYPPFMLTAVLAIAYGGYEFWRNRGGNRP